MEQRDLAASQTLKAAMSKVEAAHPGFSYDMVLGVVKKGDMTVNMNEGLLRLQGAEQESKDMETLEFNLGFCLKRLGLNWLNR